jgi:hypothetical protein
MKAPLVGLTLGIGMVAGGAYLLLGGRMPRTPALAGSRRRSSLRGEHEADELKLYIDNDSGLYHSQTQSIIKNLKKRLANGTYNRELAEKLWGYLTEAGAKKYAREFGSESPWNKMFSVADRKAAAKAMNDDFLSEYGR